LEAPLLITQALRESRLLPTLILAIWLIFVGTGLWQHIKVAETPPNYDPLSYIEKGEELLGTVRAGNIGTGVHCGAHSAPSWYYLDVLTQWGSPEICAAFIFARSLFQSYCSLPPHSDRLSARHVGRRLLAAHVHLHIPLDPAGLLSFRVWCFTLARMLGGSSINFMAGIAASSLAAALRSAREDARTSACDLVAPRWSRLAS
jgi:hypothetical protein